MPKTPTNTLPDDHVCDCAGVTPRQMLDDELAALQAYIDEGGCLRSWFLRSGILGLIGTAMMIADGAGALTFEDGTDAGLRELRNSLQPHITVELVQHVAEQIAAIWDAPSPEARN